MPVAWLHLERLQLFKRHDVLGIDFEQGRGPRRAMSSASSSTETLALIRSTLDWLSTSLSKGMARDGERAIFGADFAT